MKAEQGLVEGRAVGEREGNVEEEHTRFLQQSRHVGRKRREEGKKRKRKNTAMDFLGKANSNRKKAKQGWKRGEKSGLKEEEKQE